MSAGSEFQSANILHGVDDFRIVEVDLFTDRLAIQGHLEQAIVRSFREPESQTAPSVGDIKRDCQFRPRFWTPPEQLCVFTPLFSKFSHVLSSGTSR